MALGNSDCTVAILNYNGEQWLRRFLSLVVKHSEGAVILIYDNASTDGSIAYLRASHPEVNLIEGSINLGFCEGYNQTFNHIHTPYAVLLNSDVEVTERWLGPLLTILRQNAVVAAVQPKVLSYAQRTHFEYAGAAGGYLDRFGYPFCRGRIFDTVEEDRGQYDTEADVFWATGACIAVQTAVYKKLGGLDARFFAHMEEIDWCWRAQRAGYTIRYTPQSIIYHVGGGTLGYDSPRKLFLNYRNNLLMLDNNLFGIHKYWTLLIRMVLDGVSALPLMLKGKLSSVKAIWKAHLAFYKLRLQAQRQPTVKKVQLSPFSIVWAYFIRKKKTFRDLDL